MSENWIIPCNIKYFDVRTHFQSTPFVVWKNAFTIRVGDTVYIYMGAPLSQIKYRCTVVSDKVDEITLIKNSYAIQGKPSNNYFSKKIKYIQIRKDYEYPDGMLTLPKLKEHGLGQIQIQARTDRNLQRYLNQVDNELGFGVSPKEGGNARG